MDVIISNASGLPIYEQICWQIKNCIVSGQLSPGDPLPSIRTLAKDLRISVITTKRAYDELEREGYICTVSAKGSYVADKNLELIREDRLRQIEEHLRAALRLAPACNLSLSEMEQMLRLLQEEENERH